MFSEQSFGNTVTEPAASLQGWNAQQSGGVEGSRASRNSNPELAYHALAACRWGSQSVSPVSTMQARELGLQGPGAEARLRHLYRAGVRVK